MDPVVKNISQFMCPLCGLHHSVKHYEPEDLPLDIEAVVKVGLGRGKGTKVVGRYSLLHDDDVAPKIVGRVLILCRLFLDQNLISTSDLKNHLGMVDAPLPGAVSLKEYNRLREDLESLKVVFEAEKKRGDLERDRADRLSKTVVAQRSRVKDYDRLREDCEALRAQAEADVRKTDRESGRANRLQASVNSLNGRIGTLEAQLSNAKSSNSTLRKELEEAEAREEDVNEDLDEIIEMIEDRTDYEYDPSDDSREEFIADVVPRLLEDLEALKVEDE